MIIINTLMDIQRLNDTGDLDKCVISYLMKYFIALSKQLNDHKPLNDFSLEKHGSIVFLENAEDCKKLSTVGLRNDYKCNYPEYVYRLQLYSENRIIELYHTCITISNSTAITVISTKGTLDVETEHFLNNECDS